jgi:hypothetical protein
MVNLLTYPNYEAHGYDILNYTVKILFPLFGVFDIRTYMINLHSILAVIFL